MNRYYEVAFSSGADKALAAMPKQERERVIAKATQLELNPRPYGSIKLVDPRGLYRIRAGKYRIIYQIKDRELFVLIVDVAHRREAYRLQGLPLP